MFTCFLCVLRQLFHLYPKPQLDINIRISLYEDIYITISEEVGASIYEEQILFKLEFMDDFWL